MISMMTNVVSAVRLHELLRNFDGLERYVHVTTPEVYGSTEGWVTEDTPFNPSTPYAVSRAAGDMSLRTYFANYRFPVVFTRAANVYGPGQQLYRIVPRTIVAAMGGQKLRLDGGGMSKRVFIHMTDVADATLKIARKGVPGETYHISGYEVVSIRTLVELFESRWTAAVDPRATGVPVVELSVREHDLVTLLAYGHTDATAAMELRISARSVTNTLRALMDRLGVDNRFQLGLALGALEVIVPPSLISAD